MNRENPFLFRKDPYYENPFAVLGVGSDANKATIDNRARARASMVARGKQPVAGLELQPEDLVTAAEALQDPVLRLAFDLMHFGFPDTGEDL